MSSDNATSTFDEMPSEASLGGDPPVEGRKHCDHCDETFDPPNAPQKKASHVRHNHSSDEDITPAEIPTTHEAASETDPFSLLSGVAITADGSSYHCQACSIELPSEEARDRHVETRQHEKNVRQWVTVQGSASSGSALSIGSIREVIAGQEPFTLFGQKVRPRNFLTPKEDPTIGPVNFLSNIPEKHALGLGFIVTLAVVVPAVLGLDLWTLLAAVFGGAAAARKAIKRSVKTNHVRDAMDELAYTGLGSAVAIAVILLIAAIAMVLQRDPTYILEQFVEFLRVAFEVTG